MLSSLDANRKMCHGPGTLSATATRGARNELGRWAPGDAPGASGSSGEEAEGGVVEGDAVVVGPGGRVWVGGRLRRAGGAAGGAMGMSDPWGSRGLGSQGLVTGRGDPVAFVGVEAGIPAVRGVVILWAGNGAGDLGRAKMRGGGERRLREVRLPRTSPRRPAGCHIQFASRISHQAPAGQGLALPFRLGYAAGGGGPLRPRCSPPVPTVSSERRPRHWQGAAASAPAAVGGERSRTWNSRCQSRLPCLVHTSDPPIPFPLTNSLKNIAKSPPAARGLVYASPRPSRSSSLLVGLGSVGSCRVVNSS